MSSGIQKERDLLQSRIWKLKREIDVECQVYLQNTLDDNKGYKYYSSEIDNIAKRRDKEIELLELSINEKIEALQRQLEVKKQGITDRAKSLTDDYIKKCSDIENNHKKPNTMAFRKKEEMLQTLEQKIISYDAMLEEEYQRKAKSMREEAQARVRMEQRQQQLKDEEAREKAIADRKRMQEEEDRKRDEKDKKEYLPPNVWEHISYGQTEPLKKNKIVREPLNGRNISKLCLEEIDLVDLNSLTKQENDELADRIEYLEFHTVESKQLNNEYFAEKKKKRKQEKE